MTKAFVVGATGEVGKHVLAELLKSDQFDKIVVISRKPIEYNGTNKEKLIVEIVPNFDDMEAHKTCLKDCSAGFCTLGSTKAKAGSAEAFQHIDYDYTMTLGKMALESGCKWFGVVTAVGANPNSSFLYPRVKGMIERDLEQLRFPRLAIFRPGFLLCERQESRPLERVGMFFARAVNWLVPNRIAIPTETVAKAMVSEAVRWLENPGESPSVSILDNKHTAEAAV